MQQGTTLARRATLAFFGGAALLAVAAGGVAPAYAAEPPYLGQDGQNTTIAGDIMSADAPGAQGQLEPGIGGTFYAAGWTGTHTKDTHIYRYFEDGSKPTSWDTNAAPGVSGKVFSISTDAAGNVFSLHRTANISQPITIARWTPEGELVGIVTPVVPGATDGAANGLAVSADASFAYLRVDGAEPASLNGIWKVDLSNGAISPVLQGLPQTSNADQAPWLQLDHATGALAYNANISVLAVIADPDAATIVPTEYPVPTTIRGVDMSAYSSGTITLTSGTNILSIDTATGTQSPVVGFGQINYFNTFQSRWGTDGRLYISGFAPWGVMPVDFMKLKSPEITYPQSTIVTNVCAPAAIELTPELVGTPAPTWVTEQSGALPEGLTLNNETGAITGVPAAAGTVDLVAKNGVTTAWNSEPDNFEIEFTSETTPVAFASTPAPTISGTAKVGETLTAAVTAWDPAATFTYTWLRDGKEIAGATEKTYKLTAADEATAVTVTVTGSAECRIAATATATAVDVAEATTPPGPPGTKPPGTKPPVTTPPVTQPPGGTGPLANSGAGEQAGWIAAAIAAIGAGGLGLVARKRRRS